MRKFEEAAATSAALVALISLSAGCSESKTKTIPELPEQICWGIFASKDLAPLLPTGGKAAIDADPFVMEEPLDSSTCSLYIDGNVKFQASADYKNFERSIDWGSFEKANPESINVGKKGIVWRDGAASYLECEPPKSPSGPGRYIDLQLYAEVSPDSDRARHVLPTLLKQFAAFTKRELKCDVNNKN
ncbi:hypothetical protein [Streptomyces sp. NPDC002722]|uniref:hypothetical protein n=1 Tax=unclassified Streptomyces TaxID=2593676 RepID=UPI003326EC2A